MDNDTLHECLRAAVAKADGNQSRFAAAIGTSQQLVSYWLKRRRPLPAEYVLPAEAAGFGSRHDLRPDLYPAIGDASVHGPTNKSRKRRQSSECAAENIGKAA